MLKSHVCYMSCKPKVGRVCVNRLEDGCFRKSSLPLLNERYSDVNIMFSSIRLRSKEDIV